MLGNEHVIAINMQFDASLLPLALLGQSHRNQVMSALKSIKLRTKLNDEKALLFDSILRRFNDESGRLI